MSISLIQLSSKNTKGSLSLNGKILSCNSRLLVIDNVPLSQLTQLQYINFVDSIAGNMCIINLELADFRVI